MRVPDSINLDGQELNIEIRRNRRRKTRVRFILHPEGELAIDAPMRTTNRELASLIERNLRWILVQYRQLLEDAEVWYPLRYRTGSTVHVLGRAFAVELRPSDTSRVTCLTDKIVIDMKEEDSPRWLFHDWLYRWASNTIGDSMRRMTKLVDFDPKIVRWSHRFMSSRWGSCSTSGALSFNTHLVKTPIEAIDLVVLHELCHRQVANHGNEFHDLMTKFMPDWPARERTLKRYQPLLEEQAKLYKTRT